MKSNLILLSLLRSKNKCLLRYHEITSLFVMQSGDSIDVDELSKLESARESVLRAISLFNLKINEKISTLPDFERTSEFISLVRELDTERDQVIERIREADCCLIKKLDLEKSKVKSELTSERRRHQQVGKFKSQWVGTSGSEIDQKL